MSRFLTRKSASNIVVEDEDRFVENPLGLFVTATSAPTIKPLPEDGKHLTFVSAPYVAPEKAVFIPADDLPENWTWVNDSTGRIYYVNIQTGVTQWGRPGLEDIESQMLASQKQKEIQLLEQASTQRIQNERQQRATQSWQHASIASTQAKSAVTTPQSSSTQLGSSTGTPTIGRGTITTRSRPAAFTKLHRNTETRTITNPDSIYGPSPVQATMVIAEGSDEDDPPPPPPGLKSVPTQQHSATSTATSDSSSLPRSRNYSVATGLAPPPPPPDNSTPGPVQPAPLALAPAQPTQPAPLALTPAEPVQPAPLSPLPLSLAQPAPLVTPSLSGSRKSSNFKGLFKNKASIDASSPTSQTQQAPSQSPPQQVAPLALASPPPSTPTQQSTSNQAGTRMETISLARLQQMRKEGGGGTPLQGSRPISNTVLNPATYSAPTPSSGAQLQPIGPSSTNSTNPPAASPPLHHYNTPDHAFAMPPPPSDDDDDLPPPPPPPPM